MDAQPTVKAKYAHNQRPNTTFTGCSETCLDKVCTSEYSVLVGRNNCGKTFILKTLAEKLGQNASYLGPARYQNFTLLGFYSPTRSRKKQKHEEFLAHWRKQAQNMDNSTLNLQQAIADLSDKERASLKEIIKLLLGTDMEILLADEGNSMSQKYVAVGDHNLSFSSSGFRLITVLITSLLNSDYDTFLIDEPELGISPEAQGILADFLFDRQHRKKYFPHVKTLISATHSSLFLDRKQISNNYLVEKTGDAIDISQAKTQQDFNRIHFFLLGNRFETLYLPSLIILVEGKSDYAFIRRVLETRFPNQQFSLINAAGESRMKEIVSTARDILTDMQRSPYRERIVAVLDSVHGPSLKQSLVSMGMPADNIVTWSKNGIEYLYPQSVLDQIYAGAACSISIFDDRVSANGMTYTKAQLAEKVCALITEATPMSPEFDERFLALVKKRIG